MSNPDLSLGFNEARAKQSIRPEKMPYSVGEVTASTWTAQKSPMMLSFFAQLTGKETKQAQNSTCAAAGGGLATGSALAAAAAAAAAARGRCQEKTGAAGTWLPCSNLTLQHVSRISVLWLRLDGFVF